MKKTLACLLFSAFVALPTLSAAAPDERMPDRPRPEIKKMSKEQRALYREIMEKNNVKGAKHTFFETKRAFIRAVLAKNTGDKEKKEALNAYSKLLDAEKNARLELLEAGLPADVLMERPHGPREARVGGER